MAGYGWTAYDARKGGTQIINDTGNNLDLINYFVKISHDEHYGNWGLKVKGFPRTNVNDRQKTAMIFYLGSEDPVSNIKCEVVHRTGSSNSDVVCKGTTTALGSFKLEASSRQSASNNFAKTSLKSMMVPTDAIWKAKSLFTDELKAGDSQDGMISDNVGEGNLHFIHSKSGGEFELDIMFSAELEAEAMELGSLTNGIENALSMFNKRFDLVYAPQPPFQSEQYVKFSKSLLSNLMGGLGYFYGSSKVDISPVSEGNETSQDLGEEAALAQGHAIVEETGPYQLFSTVPSRPFFPRGFLWDEGFHLMVILVWDLDLALEIVSSWFDLIDENGWIAREQILGPEARSKVPLEFQTQHWQHANPPTLFSVVQEFVALLSGVSPYRGAQSQRLGNSAAGTAWLKTVFPKMKKHYNWFRRTQAGKLGKYQRPGSHFTQGYRWRGWTPQHVLTSGLDDYPRAQPPHQEGLHVDALSWVGSMALALDKIAAFLGDDEDQRIFAKHKTEVMESIDGIHWSEPDQAYCDTTLAVGNVVEKVSHKGYISLFPFLVGLLGPDHPHLDAVLNLIRNPEELWSPYGLRSLSATDKYFGTEENYWRSPIWINVNYMVVQRLMVRLSFCLHVSVLVYLDLCVMTHSNYQEIAQQPGPCRQKAREIYTALRLNLCYTVFESWKETGFAWEQYNPETGKGQRTQHFTGWTALIVKILAMPELEIESQLQVPAITSQTPDRNGWATTTYYIVGIVILMILFISRRRLVRIRRRLIAP